MKKITRILSLVLSLIMILGLVACNGNTNASKNGLPTIRWIAYLPGVAPLGRNEVDAEVKRYVAEKIGVNLDIVWVNEGAADAANTMVIAGDYDVANIGQTMFASNVHRNAFLCLDDYIQYIPTAKEMLPESAFKALSVGGKLYGIHTYKDLAESWGVLYNRDLFEEYGIEFPDYIGSERDLVPLYYEITKKYNEANPHNENSVVSPSTWLNSWFLYDAICGSWGSPMVVTNIDGVDGFNSIEGSDTVFCPYLTEDYLDFVKTWWQMGQDGIIPTIGASGSAQWTEGYGFTTISCGWIEIDPHMYSESWNVAWQPYSNSIISTSQVQVNNFVINSKCDNPESAAKFIELLFSDEYLCTTLKFGIQGKDWVDADNDGVVELLERNSDPTARYWYSWYGATNSSILGGKVAPGSSPDFAQKVEDLNNNATSSKHAGFAFDTRPVTNELAACENVLVQYISQLAFPAFADPVAFTEEFRNELKANGVDKIVAEAQRQLDEWHATNN